ncbi:1,3-beta-galactosyl-N-acetylhexosamine phosphorylase [Pontiella desulfatans]|uniref:1,3-beta-galactosyl-N-acetylhexosamine phosphorylase n=1 Tax=Pontiella desulfatans TaxID=2750659 RepID=A0A6C2U5W9_PONDE|nr:1,3-beta-galactosyl-N-acetylhexosamine phosphorylase [Pontiella desulfatans]VGO15472.1 1,3-beta-galactosyl-N-acetylhexosamine phosphorylase [Pontiella desulfatans]
MSEKIHAGKGGFTLPAQAGMDDVVLDLAQRWGADAFRDSDGTELSESITELGYDIYSTLCLIRADQEWNNAHPEDHQQKFLYSTPQTARADTMEIEIMARYSKEQYRIDEINDCKKYWEVVNRTTGEVVPVSDWDYAEGVVTVRNCAKWNVYSVNFLVYQIWETTSMYNHITNNWGDKPHQSGIDPRKKETREHIYQFLVKWLETHPNTDWVRFTSMAYQFPIITNPKSETLYQDWYGYLDCMSAQALDEFEEKKGYRLRPNDIVDNGYFNSTDRVPTKAYLDWIEFVHEFMVEFTKQCVKQVHDAGKKAVMFYCDHWIGTEPYKPAFQEIGMDGIIGPCINGREVRRVADVPGGMLKELRLYPYFFEVDLMGEPTFKEGGDPVRDCKKYWMWIRRAMLRKLVHRIGYGGYLDLAIKFPDFVDYLEYQTKEYYALCENSQFTPAEAPLKVGILNAWGAHRSWGYDVTWPLGSITESLSGQPFDVEWICFDDIRGGVPERFDVIINYGYAGTSWSGGENWTDPRVVFAIREFVDSGGGLVGVFDPTSHENGGTFYQLWDILGVQKEYGLSGDCKKVIPTDIAQGHFIAADLASTKPALGKHVQTIYPCIESTQIIAKDDEGSVTIAANDFGKGRGVYLAGFELGAEQNRLLQRAIWFAAGREGEMEKRWFASNIETEIAAYPETGKYIVINNSNDPQTTTVVDGEGRAKTVELDANASAWFDFEGNEI